MSRKENIDAILELVRNYPDGIGRKKAANLFSYEQGVTVRTATEYLDVLEYAGKIEKFTPDPNAAWKRRIRVTQS